jgi:hypothetical protein
MSRKRDKKTKNAHHPTWDERRASAIPPKLTAKAIHSTASLRDERAVLLAKMRSSAGSEAFFSQDLMPHFTDRGSL